MEYNYYCDGAATMRKINGEYVREAGGWAWARVEDNKVINWSNGGDKETTNNEQELKAIYFALKDSIDKEYYGNINIYSDSSYCINIFTQWINSWKANGWTRGKKHELIENLNLIKAIDIFIECHKISGNKVNFIKVKGHSTNEFNNFVDQKAVEAKKAINN